MILCRPVKKRASLMAFSLASAPPFVKKKVSISPGVISASFAPSRALTSVAMSDVHRHQLAVEIDEALPFRRPEIDALCPSHRNRIDLGLCRPLKQCVLPGEIDDLSARHRGVGSNRSH